jgi:hypothetical protein
MNTIKSLILTVFVTLVISVVICIGFKNQVTKVERQQSRDDLYSNVKKAGVIRAAYAVGAPVNTG